MGILELHFHESEFKFAPSVSNGSGKGSTDGEQTSGKISRLGFGRTRSIQESESESETSTDTSTGTSTADEADSASGGSKAKKGLGAIVGLLFLVAVAVFANKRRGGQDAEGMDSDEHESETVEESIEIAD